MSNTPSSPPDQSANPGPNDPAELARLVDDLRETVAELRSEATFAPGEAAAHTWLSVLEAPARRRPVVPRMLLEGLFLVACAAAAALAELDAVGIAGVMIGAWVLVALIEWASSRVDRRREELLLAAPPTPAPVAPPAPDPAWYNPPVEQTLLDFDARHVESTAVGTAITRLPDPDDTMHVPESIELTLPALPATVLDDEPAARNEPPGRDEPVALATGMPDEDTGIGSWPALAELPSEDDEDEDEDEDDDIDYDDDEDDESDASSGRDEPGLDDTFERRPPS